MIALVELVVFAALVVLIAVGAVFGWERYRGAGRRPGVSGAQPTAEIFIDPETGRRMRVWFDARTGERDYRPE